LGGFGVIIHSFDAEFPVVKKGVKIMAVKEFSREQFPQSHYFGTQALFPLMV